MNNLNSILIEGNLCADPIMRYTPSGMEVCTFRIGVNRYYKKNGEEDYTQESSFFQIETWSRLAVACAKNLVKGRGVRVVGRIRQDRWIDEAGGHQSMVKIIAEHVEFKPQIKKSDGTEVTEDEIAEECGISESVEMV